MTYNQPTAYTMLVKTKKPRVNARSKFTQTREPVVPKLECLYCTESLKASRSKEYPGVCDPCYLAHVVPLM